MEFVVLGVGIAFFIYLASVLVFVVAGSSDGSPIRERMPRRFIDMINPVASISLLKVVFGFHISWRRWPILRTAQLIFRTLFVLVAVPMVLLLLIFSYLIFFG